MEIFDSEEFDAAKFVELELSQQEIISIDNLDLALTKLQEQMETELQQTEEKIRQIQATVEPFKRQLYDLNNLKKDAQKSIQRSSKRLKSIKPDVMDACTSLEQFDMGKNNAIKLYRVIQEINTINSGEEIELDPLYVLYIKHALSQLPEYTVAKNYIEKKYTDTKQKEFQKFITCTERRDLDGMKSTYEILEQYGHKQECIDFYLKFISSSIKFEKDSFSEILKSVHDVFILEILVNLVRLTRIFTEIDSILSHWIIEIFEDKLKNLIMVFLGTEDPNSAKYLHKLYTLHRDVFDCVSKMIAKAKDVNLDINKYFTNLTLFFQYTIDYYEKESSILQNTLSGEVNHILSIIDDKQSTETMLGQKVKLALNSVKYQNIFRLCEDAILRCQQLTPQTEVSINCSFLIQMVMGIFYNNLFPEILDRILGLIAQSGLQSAVIFVLIADLDEFITRITTFISDVLLKSAKLSTDDKEFCTSGRIRFSINLEQRVIESLTGFVGMILRDWESILSEQRKTDYLSTDEEYGENTETCVQLCNYLTSHINTIKKRLHAKYAGKLLTQTARGIISLMHTSIQKFTVSTDKALLLSSDLNKYRNLLLICQHEKSILEFEKFRQLCNLFMLPVDQLSEFIHEEPIASMDTVIIASVVRRREDFKTAKVESILKSIFSNN